MSKRGLDGGDGIPQVRYSEAFKRSVVQEIEEGMLTMEAARRKYSIGGKMTVNKWLRQYSRNARLGIKVIQLKEEKVPATSAALRKRVDELESQNRELKLALADERLRSMAYSTLIDVAEKAYKIEIRKNTGTKR